MLYNILGFLHLGWYLLLGFLAYFLITEGFRLFLIFIGMSNPEKEGFFFNSEKGGKRRDILFVLILILSVGFFIGDKNESIQKQKVLVEKQTELVSTMEKENEKLLVELKDAKKSRDEYRTKYENADKELKKLEAEKNEAIQKEEKEKAEALAKAEEAKAIVEAEAKKKGEEQARKAAEEVAVEEPVVYESFKNCTEMRKVYPSGVPSSHPAYEPKHDRDKDGYACD